MPYRRFPVVAEPLGRYFTVVDEDYRPHPTASGWLEQAFFTGRHSESTSAQYAGSIALFLNWAGPRDLTRAVRDLHLFVAHLRDPDSLGRVRGAGRTNRILVAVRQMCRFAVSSGQFGGELLDALYEWKPGSGSETDRVGARHKARERRSAAPPDAATLDEIRALLEHTNTARDRLLIVLLAMSGMRVGQVLGCRVQDVHFVPSAHAARLGDPSTGQICLTEGEHLHVVRRRNPNGAWSKARFDFQVPVPSVVLLLFDRYLGERAAALRGQANDMLFVALSGATRGEAISSRNLGMIFARAAARAEIRRIHPHMLRHFTVTEHLRAGATGDEIQALLGWADPRSIRPYVHVDQERRRQAVERLEARLTSVMSH